MRNTPDNQDNSLEKHVGAVETEYEEMELLECLETLREDMEDLRVTTLAEVIQRIEELHQELDNKQ
jgi:hypothetical protein